MLIRCPECGERISDSATSCPKCGLPNPAAGRMPVLARLHARKRKIVLRIGAVVCIALLIFGIVSTVVNFRWPVRYEIGTVSGTTAITQERFASLVTDAVSTWNTAASRVVLWRFPIGRSVRISLAVDTGRESYSVARRRIEAKLQAAREDLVSAQSAYDKYVSAHPKPNEGHRFTYEYEAGGDQIVDMEILVESIESELAELDDAHADGRLPGSKDTYIAFLPEGSAALSQTTSSVSITAYLDEEQLRGLILHALGHSVGLEDNSRDDVMSSVGTSEAVSQETAASLHGWWK